RSAAAEGTDSSGVVGTYTLHLQNARVVIQPCPLSSVGPWEQDSGRHGAIPAGMSAEHLGAGRSSWPARCSTPPPDDRTRDGTRERSSDHLGGVPGSRRPRRATDT